jgi:hypothetical protein
MTNIQNQGSQKDWCKRYILPISYIPIPLWSSDVSKPFNHWLTMLLDECRLSAGLTVR